jgi:hypothetical protein
MTSAPQRYDESDARGRIDVVIGDVNDVEAHISAQYVGFSSPDSDNRLHSPSLSGHVRGPFCEGSRTLSAAYQFRPAGDDIIVAVIPDPCQWSPELPHVYHVSIEAWHDGKLVASYEGAIGLHRTTPRRSGIEFPG